MTNRQSNIIFYTVISLILTAIVIHVSNPEYFGDLSKSKEELQLKEAVKKGDHKEALHYYQVLLDERITNGKEINAETAVMYEDMAKLHSSLGLSLIHI